MTPLEIRSYNLRPGTRAEFERLFVERALPMLQRCDMDVVACGASAHDEDSWFLMRCFPSLAERDRQEDAFYGSDEWKLGPREAILALIENYTTILIEVDASVIDGLRKH